MMNTNEPWPARPGQDDPVPPPAAGDEEAPSILPGPVRSTTAPRRRAAWLKPAVLVLTLAIMAGGGAGAGAALLLSPGSTPPASSGNAPSAQAASVVKTTTTDESNAVISAVNTVSPAVVVIQTSAYGFGSVSGVGSGFIYNPNGYILTNNHVIAGAGSITVTLADGRSFPGTVVTANSSADLAVVKIDATGLPVAPLGSSSDLTIGQLAIVIGDPLGEFSNTVTTGVISGLNRSITAGSNPRNSEQLAGLIQTDAAINEGNSGGPVVNAAGQVVGIATAAASNAEGIGFAIPIDSARAIMSSAIGTSA
jgi:serine protease Do